MQVRYEEAEQATRDRIEREIAAATDDELGGPIGPGDIIDGSQTFIINITMLAPRGPDDTHFEEWIRRALVAQERSRRAGLTAHQRIAESKTRGT